MLCQHVHAQTYFVYTHFYLFCDLVCMCLWIPAWTLDCCGDDLIVITMVHVCSSTGLKLKPGDAQDERGVRGWAGVGIGHQNLSDVCSWLISALLPAWYQPLWNLQPWADLVWQRTQGAPAEWESPSGGWEGGARVGSITTGVAC